MTIASLRAEIATIRATLERGDFAVLPSMLDLHSERVQVFCARPDARGFQAEVRALQAEQQAVVALMRARQQELIELMRAQRRSTHVARAYAQAGLAP